MAEVPGPWVDNHCHVAMVTGRTGEHDEDVAAEAREAGVVALVNVGTDAANSTQCIELAQRVEGMWATAGVHPHDAAQGTGALDEVVAAGLESGRLVAIGECGLDHHYDHSPRADQRRVFTEQIDMAHELDLPLVIHTRSAWDETFELLDSAGVPRRTVFHCFTGGPREAERCLERGALLSISGIVTFPGAPELRDAVRSAPLERLMVETDSPFLTPAVPHRGTTNRPAHVGLVGAEVARLLEVPVQAVATATTATADEFYGLGLE